jgi:hypothetical protein
MEAFSFWGSEGARLPPIEGLKSVEVPPHSTNARQEAISKRPGINETLWK